ncbi:MAG: type II secretion system F family protein [Halanaerobiaceae bacterium]
MPLFKYEARDQEGNKVTGEITSDEDSSAVAHQLRDSGYYIINIEKKQSKKDVREIFSLQKRVKNGDLAIFSQQFAAMIDAGISLVDCLEILQEEVGHPTLREVAGEIQGRVETGTSLSDALQEHPGIFPPLYCQMVRAGETGGVLDRVLRELSSHYERQDEINGKIRSAMIYPAVILFVAVIVVILLLNFVVPTFAQMFKDVGGSVPWQTRFLLGVSSFAQSYWWAVILGSIPLGFLLLAYSRTPGGKKKFHKLLLNLPIFGTMFRKVYLSRFSSTLSILLESGVDLLSALSVVEDVVGNKIIAGILTDARTRIREGVNFYRPLEKSRYFPGMVVQMIRVGEEAGALESMLMKISDYYDREVERTVEGTISMIEPVLIVILAGIVGFVVYSIVMPMFDLYSQI